jgi:hypothetical protein
VERARDIDDLPAGAEKYIRARDVFRLHARNQFLANNPGATQLLAIMNDYVAKVMFALSGQDISSVDHARYVSGLMVSFTRTHFIAADLVTCCDLIDAATLLRKQFELVARLQELEAVQSIEKLLNRTPNIRHLHTHAKKIYSEYCRVAHSAHPEPLQLLGESIEHEHTFTAVYPHFDPNAYVALQHQFLTVIEYYVWAHRFLRRWPLRYNFEWGEKWLDDALECHERVFPDGVESTDDKQLGGDQASPGDSR